MAQGCGEHWKGEVCVEHCERCRSERGRKSHIFVPEPDFFREHPDTALGFEARCPVCDEKWGFRPGSRDPQEPAVSPRPVAGPAHSVYN